MTGDGETGAFLYRYGGRPSEGLAVPMQQFGIESDIIENAVWLLILMLHSIASTSEPAGPVMAA